MATNQTMNQSRATAEHAVERQPKLQECFDGPPSAAGRGHFLRDHGSDLLEQCRDGGI